MLCIRAFSEVIKILFSQNANESRSITNNVCLIKSHTGTIYWKKKNRAQERAVEVGHALLINILSLL